MSWWQENANDYGSTQTLSSQENLAIGCGHDGGPHGVYSTVDELAQDSFVHVK